MKDLTESDVQESWHIMVLCIPKVPLQGFSSVPAESVLALYYNIEVEIVIEQVNYDPYSICIGGYTIWNPKWQRRLR
jgi:hypothetical protein